MKAQFVLEKKTSYNSSAMICTVLHMSKLQNCHNWDISDASNTSVVLEVAHLGSNEALHSLPYRGALSLFLTLTLSMKAVIKGWEIIMPMGSSFFRFLQLRHPYFTQFRHSTLHLL